MSTKVDTACVSIERLADGRRRMVMIDNEKIELSETALDSLIKRERLNIVPKSELRALIAQHQQTVNWKSLASPAKGYDEQEIANWKQVARYQEQFRNAGDGWAWWSRFCAINTASLCSDIILTLNSLAAQYRDKHRNGLPIDFLELLRKATAESGSNSVAALRAAIVRDLEDDADE